MTRVVAGDDDVGCIWCKRQQTQQQSLAWAKQKMFESNVVPFNTADEMRVFYKTTANNSNYKYNDV